MTPEDFPEVVRQFILRNIDSYELLQVLLLLHANPTKQWSPGDISIELRSTLASIEKRLADLYARGVLTGNRNAQSHSFTQVTPETEKCIDALASCNRQFPNRVIELIFGSRNETLKDFASAFVIGKKED